MYIHRLMAALWVCVCVCEINAIKWSGINECINTYIYTIRICICIHTYIMLQADVPAAATAFERSKLMGKSN